MKNKKLSIVIITKNEESTIGACLKEADKINFIDKKIMLVDSNSTDRTLKIAQRYPIKIIKLIESNIYSPSAGRKVGLINSRGNYILFLDGDQIVNRKWLKKYLGLMDKDYFDLVDGDYIHVPHGKKARKFKEIFKKNPVGKQGSRFHGTFLIRNSEILKEENFDPFMRGEEERDFAYRLIKKGYRIYRSKEEMAAHFLKKQDIIEMNKKIKFMVGIGQIIKKHIFSRFYKEILKDFHMFFIMVISITILIYLFLLNFYLGIMFIYFSFAIMLFRHKLNIKELFSIQSTQNLLLPLKVIEGIFIAIFERKEFKYKILKLK